MNHSRQPNAGWADGVRPATGNEARWHSVRMRERAADGAFVYAVRSTGIYCRPSCPSRKPRPEQVVFFALPEAAEQQGFRPCRRCRPRATPARDPQIEVVARVCRQIESEIAGGNDLCGDVGLTLRALSAPLGLSPHQLERAFRRVMGITPRQYADAQRMGRVKSRLRKGDKVTTALYEAGFGSSSRLYERAPSQLGMTPAKYREGGSGMEIHYTVVDSPLGRLLVGATERGVSAVYLGETDARLEAALRREYPRADIRRDHNGLHVWVSKILEHLRGQEPHLDLPTDVQATAFQRRVWEELRRIPYGTTKTYGEVARAIGSPKAIRAVARACATNPVSIAVPCHRVVREDGNLAGYRWGIERKRILIEREKAGLKSPRIGRREWLLESPSENREAVARLLLEPGERDRMWQSLVEAVETYLARVRELPVSAEPTPEAARQLVGRFDFAHPMAPEEAIRLAADSLSRTQVHTPHPRYFGLFNPTPTTVGIAADALVAAFNPQLAHWKHNPFAVESERFLIRELGLRFGYAPATIDGVMASGGSEANHTALLAALAHAFPKLEADGLRGLGVPPMFYVSAEGHHSFHKAARLCGLGNRACREIPVDGDLRMQTPALESAIREDRRNGFAPFLVVGTVGTTNAGAIDPLAEIAAIAARENIWFHADAAWGGAAALVPELRPLLCGIESADSVTLDAHKWLSVPMGAGIFLTRHREILHKTFHISAAYVPPRAAEIETADPYEGSMQWSRRFSGLKVFLSLAVVGWDGYAAILRRMVNMGAQLRRELEASDWQVVNSTPLPICCFRDRASSEAGYVEAIAREVIRSGKAWISTTRLRGSNPVLRACITSYRTSTEDLRILLAALNDARAKLGRGSAARSAIPEA
jgi:O-6-methylguanine DNA methyltransferase